MKKQRIHTVGIITEYNPFHNGHLYHIKKTKEETGAQFIVVVMSGNFVQRGTPAFLHKYQRTHMALTNGADMVFELPVRYATGSAEYFSSGAITLLHNLGFIDAVCFGTECGNLTSLSKIADLFLEEPPFFKSALQSYLKTGDSYPTARAKAAKDYFSNQQNSNFPYSCDFTSLLSSPNNILGIEYLKSLKRLKSSILPFTIKRQASNYHDSDLKESKISSATAIRSSIHQTEFLFHIKEHVPYSVYQLLQEEYHKTFPIQTNDFSSMLYYALHSCSIEDYSYYADISPELARRIQKQLIMYTNYEDFSEQLKTKQYTKTRINRGLLHLLLKIPAYSLEPKLFQYSPDKIIPYAHLLGLKKEASFLLRNRSKDNMSIITKIADAKKHLSQSALSLLHEDMLATNLYNYVIQNKYNTMVKNDYMQSPLVLSNVK